MKYYLKNMQLFCFSACSKETQWNTRRTNRSQLGTDALYHQNRSTRKIFFDLVQLLKKSQLIVQAWNETGIFMHVARAFIHSQSMNTTAAGLSLTLYFSMFVHVRSEVIENSFDRKFDWIEFLRAEIVLHKHVALKHKSLHQIFRTFRARI